MLNETTKVIEEINALARAGNVDMALLTLDKIIQSRVNLPTQELFLLWQQKCSLLLKSGLHDAALEEAQSFYDRFGSNLDFFSKICWKVMMAEINIELEQYEVAQVLLQQSLQDLEVASNQNDDGETTKDFPKNLNDLRARIFILSSKIHYYSGSFERALNDARKALTIIEAKQLHELECMVHQVMAMTRLDLGQLNSAEQHGIIALENARKLGDVYYQGKCLNTLGVIKFQQGDLKKALKYQQESLQYKKEIGSSVELARVHFNLGMIHHETGNLESALYHCEKSLHSWSKARSIGGVATALIKIGIIYHERGQFDRAKEKLEESLRFWIKGGYEHTVHGAETLFHLINTCLELNDDACTEKNLSRLQRLGDESESRIIKFLSRLATALVLKSTNKLLDLAKALELVKDLCSESVSYYTYFVKAHLLWADLLLKDLKLASSEDKITELRNIINKIDAIAENQGSPRLIAESKLLQAKILVYDLKFSDALKTLSDAESIAREMGLTHLALKISHEFDNLLLKLSHFEDVLAKNMPNYEKLEILGLQEIIDDLLMTTTKKTLKITPNIPILVLITDKRGLTLYSRSFSSIKDSHQTMMGSILMAINSVLKTVFQESDSQVQRIAHGDLFIIVIPDGTLFFSYVLKGSSFFGIEKLKTFIYRVKQMDNIIKKLSSDIPTLSTKTKKLLDKLSDEIFLKSKYPSYEDSFQLRGE